MLSFESIHSSITEYLDVLVYFKDATTIKEQKNACLFPCISSTRSIVLYSTTFNSHLHKLQSVFYQKVTRICISLLLGLSYRLVELGMSSGGN